jgi:hypothetical protein
MGNCFSAPSKPPPVQSPASVSTTTRAAVPSSPELPSRPPVPSSPGAARRGSEHSQPAANHVAHHRHEQAIGGDDTSASDSNHLSDLTSSLRSSRQRQISLRVRLRAVRALTFQLCVAHFCATLSYCNGVQMSSMTEGSESNGENNLQRSDGSLRSSDLSQQPMVPVLPDDPRFEPSINGRRGWKFEQIYTAGVEVRQ